MTEDGAHDECAAAAGLANAEDRNICGIVTFPGGGEAARGTARNAQAVVPAQATAAAAAPAVETNFICVTGVKLQCDLRHSLESTSKIVSTF